ncbi:MAG: diaminopimelate epimerase, partial [Deltaproteobacteria bacterium]|nr:diaminopimelate epimerase [Deltaproteobacteria bacterium]
GGRVESQVFDNGRAVRVEMGNVSFTSNQIPVTGKAREVLNEKIIIAGEELIFNAATIGNPHCVIVCDTLSLENVKRLGPLIETNEAFPNRINVQFMQVRDRHNIQIEIWERGAGYTLASGSSSSASAAVAHRLGLCDSVVNVHMPGGVINIHISDDYFIIMTGSVTKVSIGEVSNEIFNN